MNPDEACRGLFDHMLNGAAYCRVLTDGLVPHDFVYLEVNAAFEAQTGLKDVVGKRATEVIPGIREADPGLLETYSRVATSGRPEQFELEVKSLGHWISVSVYSPSKDHFVALFDVVTKRRLEDDGGSVLGAVHVVRNVTERTAGEAARRELQERLAYAMDQASLAYWELDVATGTFTFNDRFYRLYETTAEREGGYQMSAEAYAREFLPPEGVPAAVRDFESVLASPLENFEREHRIRRRDGALRDILVRCRVERDATGRAVRIRGSSQDITKRKRTEAALSESETQFRQLFEQMEEGCSLHEILIDGDGQVVDFRFLEANAAYERHTGQKRSEIIGRRILEVNPNADLQQIARYGQVALTGEPMTFEYESKTFRRHFRAHAFRTTPGRFATVFQDITEQRLAAAILEQRVRDVVAELREKDRVLATQSRHAAMGEMIGNIAHQWRQPLNAVGLVLANLRDAARAGELDLATVESAFTEGQLLVQKMSSTINDFRDFFRPKKDKQDFSTLLQVREALRLVESSYRNAGIVVEVQAESEPTLYGFANEYSQVVLNLLSNAAQAIKESQVVPGRVLLRVSETRGFGVLTVADNGGGVPAAILERIFDPYFSTREGGTGVGLYMSQQILERGFGGKIRVKNVGDGAEFEVLVPLASGRSRDRSD